MEGSSQASGSFQDWLSSLPGASDLAPAFRKGYGEQHRAEAQVVPAMWLEFAKQGEPLINQGAQAQRKGVISGAGNARRELERNLLNSYQSAGVNSLYAKSNLAQSLPQVGYQTEQQLAGVESNRLDEIFGFRTGIQNALAQGYGNERVFAEQLNQAYKARRDARSAQQFAQRFALFSGLTTAGGSAFLGGISGDSTKGEDQGGGGDGAKAGAAVAGF